MADIFTLQTSTEHFRYLSFFRAIEGKQKVTPMVRFSMVVRSTDRWKAHLTEQLTGQTPKGGVINIKNRKALRV